MPHKKESLFKLLKLVEEISHEIGNEWFVEELFKLSSKKSLSHIENDQLIEIKSDTTKIINLLDISPKCSIDYSFIEHNLLRTRLEIDNLRMENVRYNLKEKDEMKRLYDFCINAFYQVENLLNFYYFEKYPKIENLLSHLESIEKTSFRRYKETNVGDVTIATKIYSFTRTYFTSRLEVPIGMNIDSLRQIRNEGLHRCSRIKSFEDENKRLHQFLRFATFDSVHSTVNSLVLKIKTLL